MKRWDAQDRQNLLVGVIVVALVIGGYWLVTELRRNGQIEDCLMRRQRNCETLFGR